MAKEKSDNITTKYNASLWISVLYQWEKMRKKLEESMRQRFGSYKVVDEFKRF